MPGRQQRTGFAVDHLASTISSPPASAASGGRVGHGPRRPIAARSEVQPVQRLQQNVKPNRPETAKINTLSSTIKL